MKFKRLYLDTALRGNAEIVLDSVQSHYVAHVLRLKPAERLLCFNGRAPLGEYQGKILRIDKKQVVILIENFIMRDTESPLSIILYQGICKGERMDFVIQKAVELGVHKIVPLQLSRSAVRFPDEKRKINRMRHWQGVYQHALQQSGRVVAPNLTMPQVLEDLTMNSKENRLRLLPDPGATLKMRELGAYPIPRQVEIIIGPEGGFSEEERRYCQQLGFISIQMGRRILRTETAALALIAYLQALWGDF